MNAIYKFVLGMIGKRSGVVTTLPSQKQIEFQANMLAEKFMQNGIDPNALKSPEQVKNVLANIDQANMRVIPADSSEGRGITKALGIGKKADVMDMKGNKINTSKGIMGGEEVPTSIDQESFLQRVKRAVDENKDYQDKKKAIDELENYTKSKEDIVQDLVDRKFGKGYFDTVDESDAAIKARLDADNKKGIESIKINLVDDSIAKIKSMEPMDAMKEANLVAGKKGKYANLDDNQVKKIMDDTEDHIFERDIPEEDFATGGRVGLKGGSGFLKFLKKFKIKQSGDDVKEFLSKRQFMKDIVGNTEKAKKARELREIKKNVDNYMKQYKGYQFPSDEQIKIDLEKKIQPILNKGRKLNADGGRIGYAGGSYSAKGGYQGKGDPTTGANVGTPESNRGTISGGDGGGNNKPPPVVTRTVTKPNVKDKIRRVGNTIGDISYFKNLINLNPYGIAKNIGGKILMDKILGDQSSLDTEDENNGIMKMADVSAADINRLINPVSKKPKYSSSQDVDDIRMFEEAAGFEFNPTITDQEIRDVLDKKIIRPTGQFAADGGRIGYKAGSVDKMRRLFLKTIGASTAGIAGAKSGIFSFGKGAGKEVAKEVAQQTTSSMPPPYFFKLAEKIKTMGDDATATTDRTIAKTLKSKDGKSTYLLEEDVTTGDTIIKKINKEGDEMITDVEIMELKKGEVVMGKDGRPVKVPDEYEEVTEINSRIYKDQFNNPDYSDGIQVDEIIKEVDDKVPSIKYASGGLAYMLGE